jgi:hypothetical protein
MTDRLDNDTRASSDPTHEPFSEQVSNTQADCSEEGQKRKFPLIPIAATALTAILLTKPSKAESVNAFFTGGDYGSIDQFDANDVNDPCSANPSNTPTSQLYFGTWSAPFYQNSGDTDNYSDAPHDTGGRDECDTCGGDIDYGP